MRRRLSLLVLALATAGALGAAPGQAQGAAGGPETGWWSQRLGASAKPAGTVEVAWVAETPQSTAAVRVVVPEEAGEVLLVLHEVGGVATDQAGIDLCRTSAAWTPANPGTWAQRPAVVCDEVPPTLGRDESALEWVGSLMPLLVGARPGETVGVALLPRGVPPADGLPFTTPFQVDLADAEVRVLDTGAAPPAPAPAPPSPAPLPSTDPAVASPDLGVGGFVADPLPSPAAPAPASPATPDAPPSGPDLADPLPLGGSGGPARPWGRLLLLVPLSLAGGAALALARRSLAPRLAPG